MKKFYALFLFLFIGSRLFAQNLTVLERQIIQAKPEEMVRMVMDHSLEKELQRIYSKIELLEVDDVFPEYMAAFPGISEEECLFIILKVAIVSALGSGDEYGIENAFDILDFCEEIDSMIIEDYLQLPEDVRALMESPYWQDCIAFYRIFDPEVFFRERFPEYY